MNDAEKLWKSSYSSPFHTMINELTYGDIEDSVEGGCGCGSDDDFVGADESSSSEDEFVGADESSSSDDEFVGANESDTDSNHFDGESDDDGVTISVDEFIGGVEKIIESKPEEFDMIVINPRSEKTGGGEICMEGVSSVELSMNNFMNSVIGASIDDTDTLNKKAYDDLSSFNVRNMIFMGGCPCDNILAGMSDASAVAGVSLATVDDDAVDSSLIFNKYIDSIPM